MNGKPFFDTNIVIYPFSTADYRSQVAFDLLSQGGVVSVQVLNEFTHTARRKLGMSWADVNASLGAVRVLCPHIAPVTVGLHEEALAIAERFGYRVFAALIIAAAIGAGCKTLHSEDMQHGQTIDGITILNPFKDVRP